jgi:hypothetical protein
MNISASFTIPSLDIYSAVSPLLVVIEQQGISKVTVAAIVCGVCATLVPTGIALVKCWLERSREGKCSLYINLVLIAHNLDATAPRVHNTDGNVDITTF